MGKKELKRIDTDVKVKKHGKKKRAGGPKGIVDVLNCPPLSHFYYELVVGNGIGDDAVEDALAAFERAWEVRRQKAYEAATQDGEHPGLCDQRASRARAVQQQTGLEDRLGRRADDRDDLVLGRL
jgi:hypothetical protein